MRGRRMWLALGAVLLLAGGAALLVPLLRAATSGEPAVSRTVELLACAEGPGDRYCQRVADDRAARGDLTAIDRETAGGFAERLRAAFQERLGARCPPEPHACVFAEPPAAETLRAAMTAAGFSGPVVRRARLHDPAPYGAIVYAVRAGAACLVGWVEAGTGSPIYVAGRHPDGSCLPA